MSKAEEYLERVFVAVNAGGNGPIATALTQRCGIEDGDLQAIIAKIAPARAAYSLMDRAAAALDEITQTFKVKLTGVADDLSAVRRALKDNFDRSDPLYKDLGLTTDTPQAQEEMLGFAETVFANGKNLEAGRYPLLAKRKWDTARFTTALAQVAATRSANIDQEAAKGQSLAATSAFYDAVDALDELFRPFAKNARSNLADVPGALTEMGLADGLPAKPQRPLPASDRKKAAPAEKAAAN
ncbi:MAG: hypothetical protein U0559_07290 [Anaerolineae bacterium]